MKKFATFVISIIIIGVVGAFAFFVFNTLSHNELTMESIQQDPELPQGCEITSLAMILNYYELDTDKVALADMYLPKSTDYFNANPSAYYMGDPHGDGWYCYSGPIVTAANQYLSTQSTPLNAYEATGITSRDIAKYIDKGVPVILWTTLNFESPQYSTNALWSYEGTEFNPFTNLHVVVVYGYTFTDLLIVDPQGGYSSMGKKQIMNSNASVGGYAVVIQ